MSNIEEIVTQIENNETLDSKDVFSFAKLSSSLLFSKAEDENEEGRRIIIHMLNNWQKVPDEFKPLWLDLVESAGFYPYTEKPEIKDFSDFSSSQLIRKNFHLAKNLDQMLFHEEQQHIAEILAHEKNVIVSAPTSFGKSLLIEDVIASKKYRNIVIIQPTLALLDETRKKLKK